MNKKTKEENLETWVFMLKALKEQRKQFANLEIAAVKLIDKRQSELRSELESMIAEVDEMWIPWLEEMPTDNTWQVGDFARAIDCGLRQYIKDECLNETRP